MTARSLLPFAIQRIRRETEELALSHFDPVSKRVEPAEIRREMADNYEWLEKAVKAARGNWFMRYFKRRPLNAGEKAERQMW